ncbi:MAG: sigma-70 family RNA polymerase sigma factor [Defluviitaleaceae bacterium]|nr:sigma-70 family RNA polymerase sigma factor [Defluviitaleaceae bacterium]
MLISVLITTHGVNNKNDLAKIEKIYQEYSRLMLHIAKAQISDHALAEDAVSESFIKIIKHMEKFEDISSNQTKGYIVKIVRTTSIDLLRKAQKYKGEAVPDEVIETLPDYKIGTLDNLVAKEGYDILKQAIKVLPDQSRDVVDLFIVNGHSHKEISQMLGITPSASKKRLFRARQLLRKLLNGDKNG